MSAAVRRDAVPVAAALVLVCAAARLSPALGLVAAALVALVVAPAVWAARSALWSEGVPVVPRAVTGAEEDDP